MYGHKYTADEQAFMAMFVPGHSYKEIAEAFTEKFGYEISVNKVKSYIGNHSLNTGRTGKYPKGHIPQNKGIKGVCGKGCEKTWFPKGHIPFNYRTVLSERITKDGYVEIKIADPNKWILKHRYIWEKEHGPIPKGHIIIFKDNDRTNCSLDNLIIINRSENAVLNHTKLHQYSGEFKNTAIAIAKIKIATSNSKKRSK